MFIDVFFVSSWEITSEINTLFPTLRAPTQPRGPAWLPIPIRSLTSSCSNPGIGAEASRWCHSKWLLQRNMNGIWMEYEWNMKGIWMEYEGNMNGIWMAHQWFINGSFTMGYQPLWQLKTGDTSTARNRCTTWIPVRAVALQRWILLVIRSHQSLINWWQHRLHQFGTLVTLWWTNIAMENHHF